MRQSRLPLFVLLSLLAAGCGDAIFDGDNGSGGDFSIAVGTGTSPTYSWSEGPAFSIDVVRTANQTQVVWRVTDAINRNIRSPVRHGVVPTGAIESSALERTLTPGVQYRVSIRLADNRTAFQDFRP